MFVVILTYTASLEMIDQYLVAHRQFLGEGYRDNILIASGPQNPRTGGILLSQLTDRQKLETFLAQDPFHLHQLADYQVIEFDPVKFHPQFECFVDRH